MKQFLLFLLFGTSIIMNAQLQVHTVPVTTNDLIYDSNTNRIYVSIPSSNGSNGNSIGVINPNTYLLENTIFMGSEPSVLAISDNGQYIYCGFSSTSKIRRFDVASQSASLQFQLGADSFLGPYYAEDIEVIPGQPNSIAVTRKYSGISPRFAGLAIYDDGVQRPTISDKFGSGEISNKIEFKNNTTLFGYNNETTGFNFNRLAVNSGGVNLVSTAGSIPSGYPFSLDFTYNNNNAYFTNGSVVDTTTLPYVNGVFPNANGPVVYDTYTNLVCYANSNSGAITLKRYNPNTFLLFDSLPISNAFGQAKSIISCGNGCYAFNTSDNNVVIITNGNLSVDENQMKSISIFPNPTSDYLFVNSDIEIKEIKILDANGRIQKNVDFANNKIFLGNLQNGIYFASLIDVNGNITTKKIIKK
ncbi:T9SS type A sorting domain-containing protein [Flavobacterium crassostreae]|uniref:Secretion system C-terminal sorting domain-containing protein n=1 Tax=Flavobacterium crassostreae TaxID=1763534 RepID=A0A1B9E9D4_9FLAO|nr:T9SS type A sorting domain-containing protein [Flavobacterium crassostreae]OCB78559.1 hypothetical protein LPBF_00745 [Flavobacterium crassostreae]